MRHVLAPRAPATVVCALLTGCTAEVVGRPTPARARSTGGRGRRPFPITGASDSGVDQFARNALADLDTSGRRPTPSSTARTSPAAGGRLLLGGLRGRRHGRLPARPGSAARARRPSRIGRRERLLRPGVRPDRLRPALLESSPRVRARSGAGGHGARVRSRDAGPVRVHRAQHPGRDAGRLPGRRLDPLVAAARPSTSPCGRRNSTTCVRGFLLLRDDAGSDPTTSRRTAPTSTGCRRFYEGFERRGRPAAGTTSAWTGCSPPPSSPTRS